MSEIKKCKLPAQVNPSSPKAYPVLHEQVNDPAVFEQPPFVPSQLSVPSVHSFISVMHIQYIFL